MKKGGGLERNPKKGNPRRRIFRNPIKKINK
jgi:hypothetical protein